MTMDGQIPAGSSRPLPGTAMPVSITISDKEPLQMAIRLWMALPGTASARKKPALFSICMLMLGIRTIMAVEQDGVVNKVTLELQIQGLSFQDLRQFFHIFQHLEAKSDRASTYPTLTKTSWQPIWPKTALA